MIQRKYYRYIIYAVEIFVLSIIEGTPFLLPEIYFAKPLLLVSAAVSAAAFESEWFSLYFAVACGIIIDINSGGIIGITSIILGFVCYYESYWSKKYIKSNIYFVLMYSGAATIAVISMKFFIFCFIPQYDGYGDLFASHYVTRMVYTWAVTPIIYLITILISHTFRKEQRRIKVKKRKRVPPSQRSAASRRRAKIIKN